MLADVWLSSKQSSVRRLCLRGAKGRDHARVHHPCVCSRSRGLRSKKQPLGRRRELRGPYQPILLAQVSSPGRRAITLECTIRVCSRCGVANDPKPGLSSKKAPTPGGEGACVEGCRSGSFRVEIGLGDTASGADPIFGDVFPGGSGCDAAVGITDCRVIDITTDAANILFHGGDSFLGWNGY